MASTIKVDNVQNQPGTNIINKCSTTITIGASSDTVTLACGASQTGFGRTGTVDWITTPKVTGDSPITGVTGKGYFMNTTAGAITINLPAGAAGSIISMADYAGTWQTNNVTVSPNGAEKIGGVAGTGTLNTEGQSVTFVYVDSVQGWVNTMDSTSNVRGGAFIAATVSGACNTLTTVDTDYKVAKFVGPGTFCVSAGAGTLGKADYLVLAGGGSGGWQYHGAGGGAGGYRESKCTTVSGCWTASPIASATSLSITPGAYPITVGAGGAESTCGVCGGQNNGVPSIFSTITSTGGGGGGSQAGSPTPISYGKPGGSGGGGAHGPPTGPYTPYIGIGNTPPVSPSQGSSGGPYSGPPGEAGGGGGSSTGGCGTGGTPSAGGPGGAGVTSDITGTPTARGGGGGGAGYYSPGGSGGTGGGGTGTTGATSNGTAGTAQLGGGGGGGERSPTGHPSCSGWAGGSGIVVIRYKFQ